MISLLLSLVLAFQPVSDDQSCKSKKLKICGQLESTYFSQGGVENVEPVIPALMRNTELVLVQLKDSSAVPRVVQYFKSDADGVFCLSVEPGLYGIVHPNDVDSLIAGQALPHSHSRGTEWETYNSYWESNMKFPLKVSDNPIDGLVISHHESDICNLCP